MTDGVSEAFRESVSVSISRRVWDLARMLVREYVDGLVSIISMYPESFKASVYQRYNIDLGDEELLQLKQALKVIIQCL